MRKIHKNTNYNMDFTMDTSKQPRACQPYFDKTSTDRKEENFDGVDGRAIDFKTGRLCALSQK